MNSHFPAARTDDGPPRRGWRNLDLGQKAGVISAWLASVSAVVAVLAWLLPVPDSAPASAPATPMPAIPPPAGPSAVAAIRYLDGIAPQAGAADVVPLPRELRGDPAYASHPVVIRCPSNETGDEASSVTYALNSRYWRVEATVRPYYPAEADQRSVTHVLADIGVREVDGEITTRQAGAQQRARPDAPLPLTAVIEGAERLTLRVACEDSRGLVVITDARLTVAD